MLRFQSIISRIVILHIAAVLVTSILMSVALSWLLNYATSHIHNEAMQDQAAAIGTHLRIGNDGYIELDLPAELISIYSPEYGRYSYAVIDADGRVLFSSLRDRSALFATDRRSRLPVFLQQRHGEATVSGASVPWRVGDQNVWIQAGEDLGNRDVLTDDIVADFYRNVGWITLPILLVLLATDIAIFRRALQPLQQASDIAAEIGPARPGLRLPTSDLPREVLPLVQAVNRGLDRLEQAFKVQRDFTADAAHELRTPLTVLRTRLDLLGDREAGEALRRDVDGMAHIVGQLLDIAELEAVVIDPSETADLRAVTSDIVEFIAPLALAQHKTVALSGTGNPVPVHGNPEMLGRAIRNLAENAIGHAPVGSTVEFVVEDDGRVSVLDQGPGIAEGEENLIFQRFWRRDRRKPGSSGLGLSIVQRIAELHAATVTVTNRQPTGACFSLKLSPLRTSPAQPVLNGEA